ncbi:MAG: hypothetical protein WDN46_05285 [Methylocella sp.]
MGAAAQSRPALTYVQEKNPYREVLLASDRKLFPPLEVGNSGTIFAFDDQSAAIFGVFQDNPLIVERIDNKSGSRLLFEIATAVPSTN